MINEYETIIKCPENVRCAPYFIKTTNQSCFKYKKHCKFSSGYNVDDHDNDPSIELINILETSAYAACREEDITEQSFQKIIYSR